MEHADAGDELAVSKSIAVKSTGTRESLHAGATAPGGAPGGSAIGRRSTCGRHAIGTAIGSRRLTDASWRA
jgi:hypothetical protein